MFDERGRRRPFGHQRALSVNLRRILWPERGATQNMRNGEDVEKLTREVYAAYLFARATGKAPAGRKDGGAWTLGERYAFALGVQHFFAGTELISCKDLVLRLDEDCSVPEEFRRDTGGDVAEQAAPIGPTPPDPGAKVELPGPWVRLPRTDLGDAMNEASLVLCLDGGSQGHPQPDVQLHPDKDLARALTPRGAAYLGAYLKKY